MTTEDSEQSKIWAKMHPALPDYKSLKVIPSPVLRFFLLDWRRRDYVDVYERKTKVSQHSRYDRTLSVTDLQKLAEMPP